MSKDDDVQSILGSLGNVTDREDRIVMGRIAGHSVHALARREGIAVAEVHRIVSKWADAVNSDETRKNHLALESARLDMIQAMFFRRAMQQGDVASGALVEKIHCPPRCDVGPTCTANRRALDRRGGSPQADIDR